MHFLIFFTLCLSTLAIRPIFFKREDSGDNYLGQFWSRQKNKVLILANFESHATERDMAALWLIQVMRDFEQKFDKERRENSLINDSDTEVDNHQ